MEVSLLESVLDMQFEVLTTFLNDGRQLPKRAAYNNAHPYLGAPYGIYATADGYIALAMGDITALGEILELPQLSEYGTKEQCFDQRDEIKAIIGGRLKEKGTACWLERLEEAGYWASEVYNWEQLMEQPAFAQLDFVLEIQRDGCGPLYTTRCPIRVNGQVLKPEKPAPRLGQHTAGLAGEYGLDEREVME